MSCCHFRAIHLKMACTNGEIASTHAGYGDIDDDRHLCSFAPSCYGMFNTLMVRTVQRHLFSAINISQYTTGINQNQQDIMADTLRMPAILVVKIDGPATTWLHPLQICCSSPSALYSTITCGVDAYHHKTNGDIGKILTPFPIHTAVSSDESTVVAALGSHYQLPTRSLHG